MSLATPVIGSVPGRPRTSHSASSTFWSRRRRFTLAESAHVQKTMWSPSRADQTGVGTFVPSLRKVVTSTYLLSANLASSVSTGCRLNRSERLVWLGGEHDADLVARTDHAAGEHDGHHPGLADQVAFLVTVDRLLEQAVLEQVELQARAGQAGDLDDRVRTQVQAGAGGQAGQVDAAGGDGLADLSGLAGGGRGAGI